MLSGPDVQSCLAGIGRVLGQMGFFPFCALFFQQWGKGTFSGLLVKSTLLGLISAESVNIWSAEAGSIYTGEASVPFMSLPVGPNSRFLWLGKWGAPAI